MPSEQVPVARMLELIDSGAARPLIAGFQVVPTWYADRWWHIPSDAADDADYVVAGPDAAARFDRLDERGRRIDAVLAESFDDELGSATGANSRGVDGG